MNSAVSCIPTVIWGSKGEIQLSCPNLSVDIPLHSSEMKRFFLLRELLSYSNSSVPQHKYMCQNVGLYICVTIANGKTTPAGFVEQN